MAGSCAYGNEPLSSIKCGELLDKQRNCEFLQNDLCLGVIYFPPHGKLCFSITTTNWSKLRGDNCFNISSTVWAKCRAWNDKAGDLQNNCCDVKG